MTASSASTESDVSWSCAVETHGPGGRQLKRSTLKPSAPVSRISRADSSATYWRTSGQDGHNWARPLTLMNSPEASWMRKRRIAR